MKIVWTRYSIPQQFDLPKYFCNNRRVTERKDGRKFVEGVLGLRWDNFASRVAATYFHDHELHADTGPLPAKFKEKLFRLISKEDLQKVIKAHK